MTDFNQREKALEDFFSHKQELQMKVKAKAYYKFGLWISGQLGLLNTQEAENYALSIVTHEYEPKNGSSMLDKIMHDLKTKNIDFDKFSLKDALEEYINEAKKELMGVEEE